MRRRVRLAVPVATLVLLLGAASAWAIRAEIGKSFVSATAAVTPRVLPTHGFAPVQLSSITRIATRDGSVPPPLKALEFELDKNGRVDTSGIPTCPISKLEGTTPKQARSRCKAALVGEGEGKAMVQMPGMAPVKISSPLSFFNAPPTGGRPTLIAHAYETIPKPSTLLVPIVIEKVNHGRYGYRAEVELPPIAEGYGSATLAEAKIGITLKRKGRKAGLIEAACSGGRLQVTGKLVFANGDLFPALLTSPCHPPH